MDAFGQHASANELLPDEPDVLMEMLAGTPHANGSATPYYNGVQDVAPPSSSMMPLEQLAQFGAQHEPQLAMELFYGTPLYHQQQPDMSMGHMQPLMGTFDVMSGEQDGQALYDTQHSNGSTMASEGAGAASSAPTKSNRGRKPLPRTVEERIQATQEKNRRAQRKFRERQKERVKTMEDSLGALTDQVHSLSMEVKQLATQNSVLEKVLKLRNETIDKYQNDNNVFPNTPESHIPPTPATSLSSHPPGPAPPSTDAKGGPPVAHVEGTPLAALLSGDRDAVARFQDQSFEELSTKWRQHLAQAKALLHQYDALPEHQRPPLETQIHTQVAAADQLTMLMGLFTPTYLSLLTIGVGCEEELEARGDPVEWSRQLLPSLHITEQQVAEMLSLHTTFCTRYTTILDVRKQLVLTMQSAISADISGFETRSVARDCYRLNRLAHLLGRNFKDELSAGMDYVATIFKNVLTPMQMARLYAASYPLFPDTLPLTKALMDEHGHTAAVLVKDAPLPLGEVMRGSLDEDGCGGLLPRGSGSGGHTSGGA